MKLSAFQAMLLLEIAKDSLHIIDVASGQRTVFAYGRETRKNLVDEIMNQQDHTVVPLDETVKAL